MSGALKFSVFRGKEDLTGSELVNKTLTCEIVLRE